MHSRASSSFGVCSTLSCIEEGKTVLNVQWICVILMLMDQQTAVQASVFANLLYKLVISVSKQSSFSQIK